MSSMKIERNMSRLDQALRIVVGTTLIYFGPVTKALPNDILSIILLSGVTLLALLSALVGWCPIYQAAGISTKKTTRSGE